MNRRLERVHIASLRVALMASAVFAVVYAVIATVIVVVVTNNLTSQIDMRLTSDLALVQNGEEFPSSPSVQFHEPGGGRFGAPQLFYWVLEPDGSQETNSGVTLPSAYVSTTSPQTETINGVEVRLGGVAVAGGHVVLAQTMDTVAQSRNTIAFTEFVVGLVLLGVAFVGALIGGRRVGAPIELARQRQMDFTADASHELRTPLSVIEAQTSLALSQERDTDWYRAAFQRIGNESGRIRRLVEDLLWLARVDSTPPQSHAEHVEVGVLARQAVERFAAVAEARRLTLTVDVSDEPHMVTGSPDWLDRLIGVLIDNACKYTPEHGDVQVTVTNDSSRVHLRVEDAGPGIPEAERPYIFNRFHRATSSHPGAGLGLAIADAVVRRTQGRWDVGTSPTLGGASVAVSWPRTGPAAREGSRPVASVPAPPPLSAPATTASDPAV